MTVFLRLVIRNVHRFKGLTDAIEMHYSAETIVSPVLSSGNSQTWTAILLWTHCWPSLGSVADINLDSDGRIWCRCETAWVQTVSQLQRACLTSYVKTKVSGHSIKLNLDKVFKKHSDLLLSKSINAIMYKYFVTNSPQIYLWYK